MKGLVALGVVFIVIWALAFVIFKVAGLLIHLLLIVGAIMLIMGLVRRVSGGSTSG